MSAVPEIPVSLRTDEVLQRKELSGRPLEERLETIDQVAASPYELGCCHETVLDQTRGQVECAPRVNGTDVQHHRELRLIDVLARCLSHDNQVMELALPAFGVVVA